MVDTKYGVGYLVKMFTNGDGLVKFLNRGLLLYVPKAGSVQIKLLPKP